MAEFELIVKEKIDPAKLFTDNGLDPVLDAIKKKARDKVAEASLETSTGRKLYASVAYQVARSKTFLKEKGLELTAKQRDDIKKTDAEIKRMWEECEKLQDEIRKPLTNWEVSETARIKAEAEAAKYAADWDDAIKDHDIFLQLKELERTKAELEAMKAAQAAETARIEAERMAREKAEREAEEARQVEIARQQQAEIDEANRLAREKRIAEEAAERARKEAEQKLIDAENKRISDLTAAQAKAEAEKKALADAQEKSRIEAERKRLADIQTEKDRAAEEKRAMIEAQAKKDREADELAAKEKARIDAEKAEEEKRQKNVAHQKKINNEALNSLVNIDINLADAKRIVEAIIKGKIANVFIQY
jgi:hypothetical protein